jgi:hypothetical protein
MRPTRFAVLPKRSALPGRVEHTIQFCRAFDIEPDARTVAEIMADEDTASAKPGADQRCVCSPCPHLTDKAASKNSTTRRSYSSGSAVMAPVCPPAAAQISLGCFAAP